MDESINTKEDTTLRRGRQTSQPLCFQSVPKSSSVTGSQWGMLGEKRTRVNMLLLIFFDWISVLRVLAAAHSDTGLRKWINTGHKSALWSKRTQPETWITVSRLQVDFDVFSPHCKMQILQKHKFTSCSFNYKQASRFLHHFEKKFLKMGFDGECQCDSFIFLVINVLGCPWLFQFMDATG